MIMVLIPSTVYSYFFVVLVGIAVILTNTFLTYRVY
jgi:hypothetical protein